MTNKLIRETAAEQCEYCHRAIWADAEIELYVTSDNEFECPKAPRVVNPAGSQYPMVLDCHQPA